MMKFNPAGLEMKYSGAPIGPASLRETRVSGYASVFGQRDQSGDTVIKGAFSQSLQEMIANGRKIKMLWQHDPTQPIGVWDTVHEDERGLFVSGTILEDVGTGREALSLLHAGAIDGLSIGYKVHEAIKRTDGGRDLKAVELWEVSLVTFPMLLEARAAVHVETDNQKPSSPSHQEVLAMLGEAKQLMAQSRVFLTQGGKRNGAIRREQ